ncbi:hypothetical protein ACE38V_12455 [Cytobacillus sp. Hz8]|uniref:hypothetical protein n=1 Tax=Cytobacillus sp. Hz8 TaxID=3347168 RepID=UPI0035DF0BA2
MDRNQRKQPKGVRKQGEFEQKPLEYLDNILNHSVGNAFSREPTEMFKSDALINDTTCPRS